MRRAMAGVTTTLILTACATSGPQRTAISTPTAETLKWQRQQARVDPAGAAAVVATGLALQLAGVGRDGQVVVADAHHRPVDLARTDASTRPLTSPLRAAPGKPGVTPVDPAVLAAAGYTAAPLAPLVVKLPPDMQ